LIVTVIVTAIVILFVTIERRFAVVVLVVLVLVVVVLVVIDFRMLSHKRSDKTNVRLITKAHKKQSSIKQNKTKQKMQTATNTLTL
jgi:FtsH-binding integral membrane protein